MESPSPSSRPPRPQPPRSETPHFSPPALSRHSFDPQCHLATMTTHAMANTSSHMSYSQAKPSTPLLFLNRASPSDTSNGTFLGGASSVFLFGAPGSAPHPTPTNGISQATTTGGRGCEFLLRNGFLKHELMLNAGSSVSHHPSSAIAPCTTNNTTTYNVSDNASSLMWSFMKMGPPLRRGAVTAQPQPHQLQQRYPVFSMPILKPPERPSIPIMDSWTSGASHRNLPIGGRRFPVETPLRTGFDSLRKQQPYPRQQDPRVVSLSSHHTDGSDCSSGSGEAAVLKRTSHSTHQHGTEALRTGPYRYSAETEYFFMVMKSSMEAVMRTNGLAMPLAPSKPDPSNCSHDSAKYFHSRRTMRWQQTTGVTPPTSHDSTVDLPAATIPTVPSHQIHMKALTPDPSASETAPTGSHHTNNQVRTAGNYGLSESKVPVPPRQSRSSGGTGSGAGGASTYHRHDPSFRGGGGTVRQASVPLPCGTTVPVSSGVAATTLLTATAPDASPAARDSYHCPKPTTLQAGENPFTEPLVRDTRATTRAVQTIPSAWRQPLRPPPVSAQLVDTDIVPEADAVRREEEMTEEEFMFRMDWDPDGCVVVTPRREPAPRTWLQAHRADDAYLKQYFPTASPLPPPLFSQLFTPRLPPTTDTSSSSCCHLSLAYDPYFSAQPDSLCPLSGSACHAAADAAVTGPCSGENPYPHRQQHPGGLWCQHSDSDFIMECSHRFHPLPARAPSLKRNPGSGVGSAAKTNNGVGGAPPHRHISSRTLKGSEDRHALLLLVE